MNLNLGMRAANAAFQEFDAQQVRDQRRREWDAQNKRADSELSMLADKAEADRTDYLMRAARNRSGLELQPSRQRVDQGRLSAEESNLAFKESMRPSLEKYEQNKTEASLRRQPIELETAGLNAQTGQSQARINQADAQVAEENIPSRMTQGRQKQAVDDYSHHTQTVASLAQAIESKDAASALKLMNGLNEALPEGQRVKPAARLMTTADDRYIVALDADGNQTGSPLDIEQMKKMASSGKVVTLNKGQTIGTMGSGGFTPAYTAPDPDGAKTRQGPLQRDVEYLKTYHGMTNEQALAHLSSAKTMTRDQFILSVLKEKAAKGFDTPTQKDAEDIGILYDNAQRQPSAAKPQAAQQPGQAPKSSFNWREHSRQ